MNRFKVYIGVGVCLIPIFLFSQISGGSGKLFRWDLYKNYTGADSTAYQRTLYDYPLPEQRIETSYQFEDGLWEEQTRLNYTFDGLGRTIENILERYDPGVQRFMPQARTQTFPRGTSLTQVDSVFTYNWSVDQNRWERFIVQRNRFNAQDRLFEVETIISFSGQNFSNRDLNFYDAQGNLVRTDKSTLINGQYTRTSFTHQLYENGLLRSVTNYAPVPPMDSVPLNRTLTTYTADNLILNVETSNWDLINKVWINVGNTNYSYTPEKQIQTLTTTTITNGISQNNRSEYTYNSSGAIVREQFYIGTGEPPEWVLDSKKFYYYDIASTLKEPIVQLIQIHPNPSRDEIRIDLPSGTFFQVFNTAGQIQASGELKGQNHLEIRQWPKGVYWVVAMRGQMRWVGKVVKE